MSTAAKFLHRGRHFPWCPPTYDIDALEASPGSTSPFIAWIRDLTLRDAMHLFWNLESLDLAYNASGTVFTDFWLAQNVTLAASLSANLGTALKVPRQRVCRTGDVSTDRIYYGSALGTANEILTHSHPTADSPIYNAQGTRLIIRDQQTDFPAPGGTTVTKQTDDLYTFWFGLEPLGTPGDYDDDGDTVGYPLVRTHLIGRGADLGTYGLMLTGLQSDLSILSGSLRLRLALAQYDPAESVTTAGTLTTLSLTPNFYSY